MAVGTEELAFGQLLLEPLSSSKNQLGDLRSFEGGVYMIYLQHLR